MVNKARLKSFIPLILSLLLGLVLVVLVEDFVAAVIVQPLLRVFWFISLIVQSISQGVLWFGFILILLIVTLASFRKKSVPNPLTWHPPPKNTGSVEQWAKLLDSSRLSNYTKWRLAQKLKRLTREFLTAIDIDDDAGDDLTDLEIPVEIKKYFEAQLLPQVSRRKWFFKRKREKSERALDLDPEVVLQYLKERLDL